MANSSILGGQPAAQNPAGRDVDALGPSDSSDSGSDVQGERTMATEPDAADELGSLTVRHGSDSDSAGTGERGSATGDGGGDGADILPDRVSGPGLDPDGLSADELAEVDVEDLVADEEATPDDTDEDLTP